MDGGSEKRRAAGRPSAQARKRRALRTRLVINSRAIARLSGHPRRPRRHERLRSPAEPAWWKPKEMGIEQIVRNSDEAYAVAVPHLRLYELPRPLRERNGFDGGDVGLVSDRHVRLLWKSRPRRRRGRRRENHRHGRAGLATLLFSASIFLSRGLSLTASLSTLTSRRGVSLASMKSSGRSGPH